MNAYEEVLADKVADHGTVTLGAVAGTEATHSLWSSLPPELWALIIAVIIIVLRILATWCVDYHRDVRKRTEERRARQARRDHPAKSRNARVTS